MFNDSLLALDEISECDPKEIGNIIYALGNGVGKQRANRSGGMRATNQWRVMILSNGEFSIAATMREAGKEPKAGQTLRLLNIPTFGQYGIFNTLHDKKNGMELTDHLQKKANKDYYGTAGIRYLEKLVNEKRSIAELATLKLEDITQGERFNSQVLRAAKRFALVALAGELATEYGTTGWQQGDATAGIIECFRHWRAFYGAGNLEEQQIFNAIKDFIARFGDSRFTGISNPEYLTVNDRAGYWKDDNNGKRLYLFNRPGLLEAINNHDLDRSLDKLKARGWLIHDKDRNTKAQRVNNRIERFYCIKLPEEVETPHLKAVV